MIVAYGGGFLQYLDNKTAATHIIASSLTPKKREEFRKYRIVKPAWVVESIKAGRLLPWESFRVIEEGPSQRVLKFGDGGSVTAEKRSKSSGYRDESQSSWYASQIRESAAAAANTHKSALQDQEQLAESIRDDEAGSPAAERGPETCLDPGGAQPAVIEHGAATTEGRQQDAALSTTPAQMEPNTAPTIHSRSPSVNPPTAKSEMTPEEYNAQLLSNPQMRNSSVVNPDFINQFYRESRLHHLSTWKAELKAQLQGAAQERASARRSAKKRAPGARRYIMHVDFDSFFAAVSIRKHPELADKPVAVAHGTGPGSEIASCNYPARAFGLRNGMWMKGALEKCPELKVLPYDFPAYEEASKKFYESILDTDGIVQSVSIDEALVDITAHCLDAVGSDGRGISEGSIWREQEVADTLAQNLRQSIREKTGCDVSIGIGGNILQAKLALRKAKPAGQFQLKPEDVLDYVGGLTVQELPGVAYSLGAKLEELDVKFVKDIRELSKERLTAHLGPKTGAKLWDYARGFDTTEVGEQSVRKSVSAEINWGIRFVSQSQAEEFVQSLCDELHRRLLENAVKGKQLTMRIMRRAADAPLEPAKHLGHGKCDTFNKSITLGVATNASEILGKEAISILRSFKFSPGDLRGLGVQMTKLEPIKQTASGQLDSSQKQLQFKPSSPVRKHAKPLDPDEIESPKKGDALSQEVSEQIQMAPVLNDESQKPLNITGTQFIMPTQIDPKVLAELPGDIRSMLVSKQKQQKQQRLESSSPLAPARLPPQSQLDRETLDALPEDVRAEVLGYYQQTSPSRAAARPSSESPGRRPMTTTRPKPVTTPTKSRAVRKRGRPPASKPGNSSLIQSSFLLPPTSDSANASEAALAPSITTGGPEPNSNEDISEDFLAALPEDLRQEVLEEHRRSRLQKRAGLNLPQQPRRAVPAKPPDTEQKTLKLPPPKPKPTFTSRKLTKLPELREALSEWYEAFKEESPYEEDVLALTKYLRRVVLEEKDIAKAVAVANWLSWLVMSDAQPYSTSQDVGDVAAIHGWKTAVATIRREVNAATRERGLAAVDFT
jgi:DNA repair protein REV1